MTAIPASMKHTVAPASITIITIVTTLALRVAQPKEGTTHQLSQVWYTVWVAMTKTYAKAASIQVQMAARSVLLGCWKEEHASVPAAIIITTSHRILCVLLAIFHVMDALVLR